MGAPDLRAHRRPGGRAGADLARAPAGGRTAAFDDVAVQQARRDLLQGKPFDAVTTLLTDGSLFQGSLLVARGDAAPRLGDDPSRACSPRGCCMWARVWLGRVPWPAGPVIERYGSVQPWPADRF
jgi:hypothetical protein